MESLTRRSADVPDGESSVLVKNHDYVSAAEKLAEYEDLDEQNRLIWNVCRTGTCENWKSRLPYKTRS